MSRPECLDTEDIVRACRDIDWDQEHNRWNSRLFMGIETSVSRLTVFDINKLFRIFHKTIGRKSPVTHAIQYNVANLKTICLSFEHPSAITVEQAPSNNNKAHAEIPQRISRGLSTKILRYIEQTHESPE